MSVAWHPELKAALRRAPAEFKRDCTRCGGPIDRPGMMPSTALAVAMRLFGVTADELASPRRDNRLVEARAFVVWSLRTLGRKLSYPEIGRHLNRDHSSVHHLHRKAVVLRLQDPAFDAACRGLGERFLETGETRHARCR